MATQNLWSYRDQICRIVEESFEVSLVICNSELTEFTLAKIFDLFNQILPTAFVLNTGYWPFYNTLKKQSICVCARYGIDCRHFKHDHHWLDLETIFMDNSVIFSTKLGQLCLLNAETEVTPITGGAAGYTLQIKLTFQYKKTERGRPRRKKDENVNINPDQVLHTLIFTRYHIQREYYPAFHTIMFQPSPFFYETYGTHFPKLLEVRPSVLPSNLPPEINQRYYTASVENMPHFSLILQNANLPLYLYSKNDHAVFSHLDPPKIKKMVHNKSSQTEDQYNMSDLWKCKELIGSLKPLWSDSRTPSCESLYSNAQSVSVNYVFESFVLDDKHISEQCTVTEIKEETQTELTKSILHEAGQFGNGTEEKYVNKEIQDIPMSITYDKEYDVQWPTWGYQKAVSKRRGRKKALTAPLYRDVLMSPQKKIAPVDTNLSDKAKNGEPPAVQYSNPQDEATTVPSCNNLSPSYANVLKNTISQKEFYEYNPETKAAVHKAYKDDPDFQWFETQFPDVQTSTLTTAEEMNENLDIAEEFIKEEMELEKNKKSN